MRDVGLFFTRNLLQNGDSIEVFLTMYSRKVFEWSALPGFGVSDEMVEALHRAQEALQIASNVAGVLSGDNPSLLDGQNLVNMIPVRLPRGSVLPKYEPLDGLGVVYWTAPRDYLLVEGSIHALVLPQFRTSWAFTLEGVLVMGIALTYRACDVEIEPAPLPINDYNAPYVNANNQAGINVYVPKVWSDGWKPICHRSTYSGDGYWHIRSVWVDCSFLWCYPPVVDYWDTRLLQSSETFSCIGGFWQMAITDWIDDNPGGFSMMPAPSAFGVRRTYGIGYFVEDEINVLSSVPPVIVRPPPLGQTSHQGGGDGYTGGGGGGVLRPIIDIILPHFGGGGYTGGGGGFPPGTDGLEVIPLSVNPGGRFLSLHDKLLSVNNKPLRIRG